jgi:hypothetical protein
LGVDGEVGAGAWTAVAGVVIPGAGRSSAVGAGAAAFRVGVGRGAESTALEYAWYGRGVGDPSNSVLRFDAAPTFGLVARAVGSICLSGTLGGGRVFGAPFTGAVMAFEPVPMFAP